MEQNLQKHYLRGLMDAAAYVPIWAHVVKLVDELYRKQRVAMYPALIAWYPLVPMVRLFLACDTEKLL